MENEDNVDDLALSLPPRQVIGPDENGIKKVIEYKFNEAGNKVKVTSTFRVRKVKMSKRAIERRSWAKFGDATNVEVGTKITIVSAEEIFFERSRIKEREVDEKKAGEDALGQLGSRGNFLMLCSTCGKKGDHFTSKCPYKDLAPQIEQLNYGRLSSADAAAASSKANSSSYVPPSMREGAKKSIGKDKRRRNKENSIWVTNLSPDAQESDLCDLFRPYGRITHISVPPDRRRNGLNRGFAYQFP
ncbi:hypothetical protein REPUB_Repub06bG0201600 [Reevesia pubescens]